MSALTVYQDFCVFPFKQKDYYGPNGICVGICMGYMKYADQFSQRIRSDFEEFRVLHAQHALSMHTFSLDSVYVDWNDQGIEDKLRTVMSKDALFVQHVLTFEGMRDGHMMISKLERTADGISQISLLDPNVGEYRFSYPAQGRELLGFFQALRSHYLENGFPVHKWVVSPINEERLHNMLMRTPKKSIAELMRDLEPFLSLQDNSLPG